MTGNIKCVGVVGTGTIGSSWTGLFLSQGLKVLVSDPAPDAEKKLAADLEKMWPALTEIGLAAGASLLNYRYVGGSLEQYYGEVDFIQENAPERPDIKNKLIGEIDAKTRPEVVIASSSSGIPSSQFIGACNKHPERVLIGHPFNPPHIMPLVEVVPHPGSSQEATKQALEFYASLGKRPVLVKKDCPGFAANRLQAALCNKAYSLVANDILSAEDVDACMTTSLGPRWAFVGPFMANVLGGGGGRDGFKHMLHHIVGPCMGVWLPDMDAHRVQYNEKLYEKLTAGVESEMKLHDPAVVKKESDELTIKLLKSKKQASTIV